MNLAKFNKDDPNNTMQETHSNSVKDRKKKDRSSM